MLRRTFALLLSAGLFTGCTVVNVTRVESQPGRSDLFVTAGDISERYESLGMIQASRSGVRLFGFWDVIGTDLDHGFHDLLIPKIRELGGDGAVNVRFHQTQYTPAAQVVGLVFFFVPLPSSVTVTAEVVKLQR